MITSHSIYGMWLLVPALDTGSRHTSLQSYKWKDNIWFYLEPHSGHVVVYVKNDIVVSFWRGGNVVMYVLNWR